MTFVAWMILGHHHNEPRKIKLNFATNLINPKQVVSPKVHCLHIITSISSKTLKLMKISTQQVQFIWSVCKSRPAKITLHFYCWTIEERNKSFIVIWCLAKKFFIYWHSTVENWTGVFILRRSFKTYEFFFVWTLFLFSWSIESDLKVFFYSTSSKEDKNQTFGAGCIFGGCDSGKKRMNPTPRL